MFYDNLAPKYCTAQSIYDAIYDMTTTEEMEILKQIGVDVRDEQRGYYYTDKAYALKELLDELFPFGGQLYRLDLAIFKLEINRKYEIHDVIAEALNDEELCKKIGFRQLFIAEILRGDKTMYAAITEEYAEEIADLNYYDCHFMAQALCIVGGRHSLELTVPMYHNFARKVYDKVMGLKLEDETKLLYECRALLISYDEFMHGLRVNQALYEQQEQQYNRRMLELTNDYNAKVQLLLDAAGRIGLLPELSGEMQRAGLSVKALS